MKVREIQGVMYLLEIMTGGILVEFHHTEMHLGNRLTEGMNQHQPITTEVVVSLVTDKDETGAMVMTIRVDLTISEQSLLQNYQNKNVH